MRRARLLLLLAGAVLLAACASEDRPTLNPVDTALGGEAGTAVGDPSVDAVLALLEGAAPPTFTASYSVTRKLGPNTTTAAVVHDGAATSITVGDVRFVDADQDRTCSLSAGSCEGGIQEARISDFSIGSSFWKASPARALRVAYARRSGEPQATAMDVGGTAATCVDVPVGPGTERYCATPGGLVAFWDTAATQIALTAYQEVADPAAFTVPGSEPGVATSSG